MVSGVAAQQGSKASEFTVSYNVPEGEASHRSCGGDLGTPGGERCRDPRSGNLGTSSCRIRQPARQARHVMRDPSSHPLLPVSDTRARSLTRFAAAGPPGTPTSRSRSSASFPDWYLGVDGRPQEAQLDLVTVVLWSLVGGSGLTSGFNLTAGAATVTPTIFDTFVAMPGGTAVYQHSAASMAEELVSGMLVFSGSNARVANGGMAPRLRAA